VVSIGRHSGGDAIHLAQQCRYLRAQADPRLARRLQRVLDGPGQLLAHQLLAGRTFAGPTAATAHPVSHTSQYRRQVTRSHPAKLAQDRPEFLFRHAARHVPGDWGQ
jgi:hypothetical protein